MDERLLEQTTEHPLRDAHIRIPAARLLTDFNIERVGGDVVLYDTETNRYHTLNTLAYDIWRLCDGARSTEQIRAALGSPEVPIEAIDSAVAQLGESGLLQASEGNFEASLPRRRLLKLTIAGTAGAAVLPIVKSVTVPDAAAAATIGYCQANYPELIKGGWATCTRTQDCNSHCAAPLPNGNCVFPDASGVGCCTCV